MRVTECDEQWQIDDRAVIRVKLVQIRETGRQDPLLVPEPEGGRAIEVRNRTNVGLGLEPHAGLFRKTGRFLDQEHLGRMLGVLDRADARPNGAVRKIVPSLRDRTRGEDHRRVLGVGRLRNRKRVPMHEHHGLAGPELPDHTGLGLERPRGQRHLVD